MHVYAIVPVATYEPASVITKSIECLKELESDNFTLDVYYVIETFLGDKRKFLFELPDNFTIMLRDTNRGYRAGNINYALDKIKNTGHDADYVAIFDVDHRPAKDYITKCVAALEENDTAVSSGGSRFVPKTNILTKVMAVECTFFNGLNQFLSHSKGYLAIQGVGVIKGSFLDDEKFNEEAIINDVDVTTRMYLKGKVAVLANTIMGDPTPTTLKDLYHQRVRWYRGLLESFSKYLIPMVKAPIPFSRKLSWFFLLIGPFLGFLVTPIAILCLGDIKKLSNGPLEFVKIFVGVAGYMWLMTGCGIVACTRNLTSKHFEWTPSIRSDV
jgi:cellulose synthase/poly-beta-1,6-N-acetylglucosamine synthase-like glycosyltransferase